MNFLKCLKSGKVRDGLPPLELENGARCVLEYILQRLKRVVFKELVRMVIGDRVDCGRKVRRRIRRIVRAQELGWGLERSESFRFVVREWDFATDEKWG